MEIGGLQKSTLIDYPGKVACTVFLIGCNFRCPWCYSSELVLPEKIKKHSRIFEKEFFSFLNQRKDVLEGVVVCGGEPTVSLKLLEFISKIKKIGLKVKLDTNGSNPEILEKLINEKLIDYVAMDIKAPLELNFQFSISNSQTNSKYQASKYETATGVKVDLGKIKKSVQIIKNSGIDYEFRITVVPGIHTKKNLFQIAKEISPAKKFYLQSFRPEKTLNPEFEKIKPYSEEFLSEIKKEISKFFEICEIRP